MNKSNTLQRVLVVIVYMGMFLIFDKWLGFNTTVFIGISNALGLLNEINSKLNKNE